MKTIVIKGLLDPDAITLPDFVDDALIGVSPVTGNAVYEYGKIIECLEDHKEYSMSDAIAWIEQVALPLSEEKGGPFIVAIMRQID